MNEDPKKVERMLVAIIIFYAIIAFWLIKILMKFNQ